MQHPGQKNLTTATAAALLGLIVGMSPLFAHDFQAGTATLFEFSAKCKATIGPGYVEGLVASDGSTCRIAIYWMEPEFLRRREQFFCFSDFIFSEKTVRYWLDGMQKYQTYYLLEDAEEALVPEQASQDSVVRSALAIVGRVGPMTAIRWDWQVSFTRGGRKEHTPMKRPPIPNITKMDRIVPLLIRLF